jgi:hypothetical protein
MKHNPNISDKRYKDGVDAGVMSKLKIALPLKPISEMSNTEPNVISMGEKIILKQLEKKKKKDNEKIYSFTMKNKEAIIAILNKNGYNITKK